MIYLVKVSLKPKTSIYPVHNYDVKGGSTILRKIETFPFDLCKVVHNDQTFSGKKIQRNILPEEEKEA